MDLSFVLFFFFSTWGRVTRKQKLMGGLLSNRPKQKNKTKQCLNKYNKLRNRSKNGSVFCILGRLPRNRRQKVVFEASQKVGLLEVFCNGKQLEIVEGRKTLLTIILEPLKRRDKL